MSAIKSHIALEWNLGLGVAKPVVALPTLNNTHIYGHVTTLNIHVRKHYGPYVQCSKVLV